MKLLKKITLFTLLLTMCISTSYAYPNDNSDIISSPCHFGDEFDDSFEER